MPTKIENPQLSSVPVSPTYWLNVIVFGLWPFMTGFKVLRLTPMSECKTEVAGHTQLYIYILAIVVSVRISLDGKGDIHDRGGGEGGETFRTQVSVSVQH